MGIFDSPPMMYISPVEQEASRVNDSKDLRWIYAAGSTAILYTVIKSIIVMLT